jgi:hypothetical protein
MKKDLTKASLEIFPLVAEAMFDKRVAKDSILKLKDNPVLFKSLYSSWKARMAKKRAETHNSELRLFRKYERDHYIRKQLANISSSPNLAIDVRSILETIHGDPAFFEATVKPIRVIWKDAYRTARLAGKKGAEFAALRK